MSTFFEVTQGADGTWWPVQPYSELCGLEAKGQGFVVVVDFQLMLTLWRPATFEDSHANTTGSHMALHAHNSGAESGRELFKGSKDTACLLACTQKKFFAWGLQIFCEWRHKLRTFRPPWPTSPGPGCKPLDSRISLKFLLQTRLQSESFDTLDDLLGVWVQKLWSKVIKILD